MITKVTDIAELKQLVIESIMNHTSKVSKVSKGSVLNAIAYGVAKIAQKAVKDIAIIESRKFHRYASGTYLDEACADLGAAPRYGASASSAYVCIIGAAGTQYTSSANTISGAHGIVFELESDVTIPEIGFVYARVRSRTVGEETIVEAYTLDKMSNAPTGHVMVFNEYKSIGGADAEDDDALRNRLTSGASILSVGTLESLSHRAMKQNNNVLKIINYGVGDSGKTRLAVLPQDGTSFTSQELSDIMSYIASGLSLSELPVYGSDSPSVTLENVQWLNVDFDFRVKLYGGYDADTVRKAMQISVSKLFDFRFWTPGKRVEWEDALSAIKWNKAVEYIPDTHFLPRADIIVPVGMFPRVRQFIMRDESGVILSQAFSSLSSGLDMGGYASVYYGLDYNRDYYNLL